MAYSNTNKDKGQPNIGLLLKRTILWVFLLIIIFSSASNIFQQATTLKEARRRNEQAEQKISKIEKENAILSKNIEQATNSAYINRKYREYLGLGTSNDVWLLMPTEENTGSLPNNTVVTETKPIIVQWWDLFTKQSTLP